MAFWFWGGDMFDITKFSASNAQNQSLVKEFELIETYQPTQSDIQVSLWDTFNVVGLTLVFLLPIAACTWWRAGVDLLWVVVVVAGVAGAMGLWRYDKTTRGLFARQRFSTGHVSWERNNSAAKQSQKAEVRLVSGRSHSDQDYTDDVFKTAILNHQQLAALALAVSQTGKFNQDVVCKAAQISTADYGNLAAEMVIQGLLSLKGKTQQQGFNITHRGYEWVARLAPVSTPLLS